MEEFFFPVYFLFQEQVDLSNSLQGRAWTDGSREKTHDADWMNELLDEVMGNQHN